jgi:SulP family sulfate permease
MASLMGLPPVLGVFASILTAPVTALLGRNPVLIGGTASATVPFIAGAVKRAGPGGAAKVSIVAGVFLMAFCVLRLGRHIRRVPQPVISGFSCGTGAMMALSQYEPLFGGRDPAACGVGLTVVAAAALTGRISPHLPAPLVGVLAGVAAAAALGLHTPQVGPLRLGLPELAGFAWTPSDVYHVLPSAFALALVVSVNVLITSRVVEHFRGRHTPLRPRDADAELGAYGIANVCAGMFGAPTVAGIPARSLANLRCGAATRISNLAHGLFLLALLHFGARLLARIPLPALAGVTAWVGICLLDWGAWRRLLKMRRIDAAAFLTTAAAVLASNPVWAVAAGCGLYGLHALYRRFLFAAPLRPTVRHPT